ncbi:MAG: hypothetical protein ACM3KL_09595 [Alphaproteobacteria bacterium]
MSQLLLALIALALVGCAAQVLGPYSASLSPQDLDEIQELVVTRPDIHFKRIIYIHAIHPDRVYVEASDSIIGSTIRSSFTAQRRGGKWIIDERSISNYDEVILTS